MKNNEKNNHKMKFLRCKICGQIVGVVKDTNAPITCCGQVMEELVPLLDDVETGEKHVPIYEIKNNKVVVKIGSIPHPSTKDHYIEWIALVTDKGNQRKQLHPGDDPKAIFAINKDEKVLDVYAYCNIHFLWRNDEGRKLD